METKTSTKEKSRVILSEINVTPFVDVMLVLLIIFMVTAPMLQQGIGLSLPETRSSGAPPPGDPFILQNKEKQKNLYWFSNSASENFILQAGSYLQK